MPRSKLGVRQPFATRTVHGSRLFSDLVTVHTALGLAIEHGTATITAILTPFKEKETHIIAPRLDADLKSAIHAVLGTFVERSGRAEL